MAPSEPARGAAAGLVCVYYRTSRADLDAVIARVRDFQLRLRRRFEGLETQVLLRSETGSGIPGSPASAARPDEVTLMETYRLDPDASPTSELGAPVSSLSRHRPPDPPPMPDFLAALEEAALPLHGLLAGPRHVEVFVPCAW